LNKKILVVTIILLAAAIIATSFPLTVQAEKTVVPFEALGGEGVNYLYLPADFEKFPPGPDMDVSDPGGLRIAKGTYRELNGVNPMLGPIATSSEAIISITHRGPETITLPNGDVVSVTGWGHGIYRVQYNVTSGPYAGTLEGISVAEWSWDLTKNLWVDNWGNTTLHSGTGGLEGVKMNYEWYTKGATVVYGGWVKGEIIFP
jgi:hypothetical protein